MTEKKQTLMFYPVPHSCLIPLRCIKKQLRLKLRCDDVFRVLEMSPTTNGILVMEHPELM
jgi:hypothetical protein